MPPVGFEPTISAGERPQTYALDRAATKQTTYILKNTPTHSTAEVMKQELPYEHLVTLCKAETGHHRLIHKPFIVHIDEIKYGFFNLQVVSDIFLMR